VTIDDRLFRKAEEKRMLVLNVAQVKRFADSGTMFL
jgi:hypothetical protein